MSQTATPQRNPSQLWLFNALELFSDAINSQSQYAESHGISWDRFGSIAAYVFSFYGISTFLVALLINRTMLIATTNPGMRAVNNEGLVSLIRTNPRSQSVVLALLRFLAMYMLLKRVHDVFLALSVLGINDKPGIVSHLTSVVTKYVHYDPVVHANNKFMRMPRNEVRFGPTSSMLWPVFISVSYSLFVESFSSAILNTKPFLEGGITLFELSLAIQEVSSGFFFLRGFSVAKRPSEQVLMVCLFLLCDQMCNQIGTFLFKNKYRLIPLTVLNLLFIWYYIANVVLGNVFMFPLNISVTYLSLIFVIWISLISLVILALALATKNFDLSELNFTHYFSEGHRDREFFLQHLGINLSQDFHVAVLNVGIFAITLAGKSSYITEYSYVPLPRRTWLESNMMIRLKALFKALSYPQESDILLNEEISALISSEFKLGYARLITKPTSRALRGLDLVQDTKTDSTSKIRAKYVIEILSRTIQLSKCWLQSFYIDLKRKLGYQHDGLVPPPGFLAHNVDTRIDADSNRSLSSSFPAYDGKDGVLSDDDESSDDDYVYSDDDGQELADGDESNFSDELAVDLVLNGQSEASFESSVFADLVSPKGFIELLEDRELISQHWAYLKEHEGVMTRSRFKKISAANAPLSAGDESQNLLDLIISIREEAWRERARNKLDEEDAEALNSKTISRLTCVICHFNPREIITWPCKCFAICEDCRLCLATKSMEGCVCCRREVEGVSRIYLP